MTLEQNHLQMKAWNEQRARNEEQGIKKFYQLKSDFQKLSDFQTGKITLNTLFKQSKPFK